MRMTFGSMVAIAAIVFVASALWPEGRPGPSPARLAAQDKAQRAKARTPRLSPSREDIDLETEASLKERVDVEYIELAFAEALDQLGSQGDLQFYIKVMALDDHGIPADYPISISLKNVSVETALELILEQLELTYIIRDGVIVITTAEDAESVAEVRVYNCRDLLERYVEPSSSMSGVSGFGGMYMGEADAEPETPDKTTNDEAASRKKRKRNKQKTNADEDQGGLQKIPDEILAQFGGGGMGGGGGGMVMPQRPHTRKEQLMQIITTAVKPDSWEEVGGPGTIGEFDGMIVIRHNSRVHLQVEDVLQMLRDASSQQGWADGGVSRGAPAGGGFGSGGGGGFF